MLRRRHIILWSDLYAELDSAIASLAQGERPNLNLLRRSVVAWKRLRMEGRFNAHELYRVSMDGDELEYLELAFYLAHEAMHSRLKDGLRSACLDLQGVLTKVLCAHVRNWSDQQILDAVTGTGVPSLRKGLISAAQIELFRRNAVKFSEVPICEAARSKRHRVSTHLRHSEA